MKPYSIPRCFVLTKSSRNTILSYPIKFPFGEIGAVVYYRTYSQIKENGLNESFNDAAVRITNGYFSIRKHHMRINHLPWNEKDMQKRALEAALSFLRFEWTPAGRGLANCGTEMMYKKGVAVLYNCAYTDLKNPIEDLCWSMDASFHGIGVGLRLNAEIEPLEFKDAANIVRQTKNSSNEVADDDSETETETNTKEVSDDENPEFIIGDKREAWVDALRLKLNEHLHNSEHQYGRSYIFNFMKIRARGQLLKTYQGRAAGPECLRQLLIRIEAYFQMYYRIQKCKTDEEKLRAFFVHLDELALTDYITYTDEVEDHLTSLLLKGQHEIASGGNITEIGKKYIDEADSYLRGVLFKNQERMLRARLAFTWPKVEALYNLLSKAQWPVDDNRPHHLPEEIYGLFDLDSEKCKENKSMIPLGYGCDYIESEILQFWIHNGERLQEKLSDSNILSRLSFVENDPNATEFRYACIRPAKCLVYDITRLYADIFNAIGKCVVAGGKRRTAQIMLGRRDDETFLALKHSAVNPERACIAGSSNNSVSLEKKSDFLGIPEHARLIIENGEPGFFNLLNVNRFGRVHHWKDPHAPRTREDEPDPADGVNPCGESELVSKELCNLATLILLQLLLLCQIGGQNESKEKISSTESAFSEIAVSSSSTAASSSPSVESSSASSSMSLSSVESTTASSSSAVPPSPSSSSAVPPSPSSSSAVPPSPASSSSSPSTQANHRAISPYDGKNNNLFMTVMESIKLAAQHVTFYTQTITLGKTHWPESNAVVSRNRRTGISLGGIPEAITILGHAGFRQLCRNSYDWISQENIRGAKECGIPESIRKTAIKPDGTVSLVFGICSGAHYPYAQYLIRRIRIEAEHPMLELLAEAGYKIEDSIYERNTKIVEFPLHYGQVKSASTISLVKQGELLKLLQQEYADNSVSITLTFDPTTEKDDVAEVIADLAPNVKSFSMFPRSNGIYKQLPNEEITKEKYDSICATLKDIDWTRLAGGRLEEPVFCTGDTCETPIRR